MKISCLEINFLSVRSAVLAVFFGFSVLHLAASEPQEMLKIANGHYQNNRFNEAAKIYEQIINQGYDLGDIQYNLGNAFYRQESLGKAILHFERAALRNPEDADIQHNLALCRHQVQNNPTSLPDFFLSAWLNNLSQKLSSNSFSVLGILLWWAGFAGLVFWLLGKTRKFRKQAFIGALILLTLSLLPFYLGWNSQNVFENSKSAILIAPEAVLKSAPDAAGIEVNKVFEGTKLAIEYQLNGWIKVRLADGETGWLPSGVFEKI
jgi:tetratricopeptide (TPR) repeat protein